MHRYGYKEPEFTRQMMAGEEMQVILKAFSCPIDDRVEDWIKDKKTLSKEKLIQKEDLFYILSGVFISLNYR